MLGRLLSSCRQTSRVAAIVGGCVVAGGLVLTKTHGGNKNFTTVRALAAISQQQRLDFLNAKGVMKNTKLDLIRQAEFQLLNNPGTAPTKELQEHYMRCQQRLDRILTEEGDHKFDTVPKYVQTFEAFCKSVRGGWGDSSSSFVCFRDHARMKGKNLLAQRAQLSGLCYIHAPVMLQYYLVSMHHQKRAEMIDISKLIREQYAARQLEEYIFNDSGGSSHAVLELILQPNSVIFGSRSDRYEDDLRHYGPGLVSLFKVDDGFLKDNTRHSYHGSRSHDWKGHHAMILVGARKEGSKTLFLLQNWWHEKQFVEVDEEYLESCGATVYFVETQQTEIPKEFPADWARRFTENENMDKAETHRSSEGGWQVLMCRKQEMK